MNSRKVRLQLSLTELIYIGCFAASNFLSVLLESIGFSAGQIGLTSSMISGVGIASQPTWGIISDRIRSVKRCFMLCMLGTAVFSACIPLLSRDPGLRHSLMIALGTYYALLAFMRFHLMRKLRREDGANDWTAYRHTAILLLVLTVIIGGIVELTFSQTRTFDYPGILVYAFAAFAFGKMITVIISLIKKRHEENRVLAAARCVSFAHALLSLLALQVALIHRFGADKPHFALIMNSLLGGVTVALIIGMATYMLWKSGKALHIER